MFSLVEVSAQDGIEVKIGENFRPIERIALPVRYRHADPTDVLEAAQYDFCTETAFLNWLKEKKKNDAAKVATNNSAKRTEEEADLATKQGQPTSVPSQSTSTITNNCVSPLMPGLGQDILMPTQLHSIIPATQTVPPKLASQTSFDPRDFENSASDPFELTELQTLNDMDELRAVLGNSAQPLTQQQQLPDQSIQLGSVQNQPNSVQPNDSASNGIVDDVSPSEPDYQNIKKNHDYQNVQQHDYQSTQDLPNQHDYQNMQIEANIGQVTFKADKPDKPILPPRNQDQTGPNGTLNSALLPNGIGDLPEGVERAGTMNLTFNRSTPLPPISSRMSEEHTEACISSSTSSGEGSGSHTSKTPLPDTSDPSSRSRSSPPGYYSLDYEMNISVVPMPGAVALPGLPQDPPPSYPQSMSSFVPLQTPLVRGRTLSEEERNLPDPIYDAMNTEDKNFVMNIMSMGFPKSRTSRAVTRLGKDDRQVVELLCAMDYLCSEGFPEDRVEEALNLHDNDQQKAKDFLKLWKQFEELGFMGEDIKRELIIHGNNEEKVLDSLTA